MIKIPELHQCRTPASIEDCHHQKVVPSFGLQLWSSLKISVYYAIINRGSEFDSFKFKLSLFINQISGLVLVKFLNIL